MSSARLQPGHRRCAWLILCCAGMAAGCQPIEVVQPALAPASPSALFAAPPAPSGQGVLVDPFAFDPNAQLPLGVPPAGGEAPVASQLHVPVANRDWTWEQIVDAFDDYFRIQRERQVQLVGDILTEGRLDSYPLIGATVLEPHRLDSVGRYNRWESTFQTIRRRGTVRVIPDATGYLVDVTVEKDLEDLPQPENATAGAAVFRNDSSLPSNPANQGSRTRLSGSWIFIGRDPALEQEILANIQSRLGAQPVLGAPQQ
ncbi:MAG: hypothetical protein IT424_01065 [Pirellulales bacterium]|nr:hypothetical protein [Pirellulales bacterium]